MDCFGTFFTHVQTCNVTRVQNATATEWTASVHTLYMSKPVMYPVFKVLRNIYWLQGHLTEGHLAGGLAGTFKGSTGGGMSKASKYFQRGLRDVL